MSKKPSTHVYGRADEDNRQPPPTQGMRGEQAPTSGSAARTRTAGSVTLEEASGTAAAETSGSHGSSDGER
jgi:hypothetical protein